jgi:hypothetical protein
MPRAGVEREPHGSVRSPRDGSCRASRSARFPADPPSDPAAMARRPSATSQALRPRRPSATSQALRPRRPSATSQALRPRRPTPRVSRTRSGASCAGPTHLAHGTGRIRPNLSDATRAVGDPDTDRCCLVGLTHAVGSDPRGLVRPESCGTRPTGTDVWMLTLTPCPPGSGGCAPSIHAPSCADASQPALSRRDHDLYVRPRRAEDIVPGHLTGRMR